MENTEEVSIEEQVRRNLRKVVDPEIGINIVDLGLIYKIDVNEENDVQVLINSKFIGVGLSTIFFQTLRSSVSPPT